MPSDYRSLHAVPLSRVKPAGWLRGQLQRQRDGLTGHLEVAGFPFNTEGWRAENLPVSDIVGKSWWPYEQVAYWVDGMTRCGHLLGDDALVAKARRQTLFVLDHPDRDGYLGPDCLKGPMGDRYFHCNRWPHAVLFRALLAEYGATGRRAILRALARHYLGGGGDHSLGRNVLNVEIMVELHHLTRDARLLHAAESAYEAYQARYPDHDTALPRMLGDDPPRDHGVNYNEHAKLAAILYGATGRRRYLAASRNAFAKLARDHELAGGVPSSTEHLRGISSTAGYEICNIADYSWSLGHMLMLTGDAAYADTIERAVFNAAPGAVTKDFTALQYFSSANQVVADRRSNHHLHGTGSMHVSYRPRPGTECCPGNINRVFPNYAARMWMTDRNGGIAAVLHGPGEYRGPAGADRTPVRIVSDTDYPFRETLRFRFTCRTPVRFRFSFRIPGWCANASATLNGRPLKRRLAPATFASVTRTFRTGDELVLSLPMTVRIREWPEDGLSIERGPLVFALPVPARMRRDRTDPHASDAFPAWNLYPNGRWNVGIRKDAALVVREHPIGDNPWDPAQPPVTLELAGRSLPGWRLQTRKQIRRHTRDGVRIEQGPFIFTPPLPGPGARKRQGKRDLALTLVPYGSTLLRVAVFPRIGGDSPPARHTAVA